MVPLFPREAGPWRGVEREAKIAEYAAAIEREREKARERRTGRLKRGKTAPVPVSQEIDQRDSNDRRTDAKRAKGAGTNRTYLAAGRPAGHTLRSGGQWLTREAEAVD